MEQKHGRGKEFGLGIGPREQCLSAAGEIGEVETEMMETETENKMVGREEERKHKLGVYQTPGSMTVLSVHSLTPCSPV